MSLKRKFARLLGFELCKRCNRVIPRQHFRHLDGLCAFCHYSECLGEVSALGRKSEGERDRDECPVCGEDFEISLQNPNIEVRNGGWVVYKYSEDLRDSELLFDREGNILGHADFMQDLIDRMKGENVEKDKEIMKGKEELE